ncbi:MAG: NTP transferase domain-containing protein [Lentisphaerota bacterium]
MENTPTFERADPPLFGLVLTGGKSTRMKTDKAALVYQGKPQSARTFALLSEVCEKVFLSNRRDQESLEGHRGWPQIHDAVDVRGPMAGIITALQTHPDKSWLIAACDLPFLDRPTLDFLIRHRNPAKMATAFTSAHDGLPEPLCAIYEPSSLPRLLDFISRSVYCPRKAMMQSDVHLLPPQNPVALDNVNFPEEYEETRKKLEN